MPAPRIPKLPIDNSRCEHINVTESEKATLREAAERQGVPLAVWMREVALAAAKRATLGR